MKKYIKQFVKEIFTVVIGILIALFINNWNENRKDKKYVNQIFTFINKELVETNEDIVKNIGFQKKLIDTLNSYLKDEKQTLLEVVLKADGIHMPNIKINSWKAISNSKIELVDYDKISRMVTIEEGKDIFERRVEKLTSYLYENLKEKGSDKKELMRFMLLDLIGHEKSMQSYIEKTIEE